MDPWAGALLVGSRDRRSSSVEVGFGRWVLGRRVARPSGWHRGSSVLSGPPGCALVPLVGPGHRGRGYEGARRRRRQQQQWGVLLVALDTQQGGVLVLDVRSWIPAWEGMGAHASSLAAVSSSALGGRVLTRAQKGDRGTVVAFHDPGEESNRKIIIIIKRKEKQRATHLSPARVLLGFIETA